MKILSVLTMIALAGTASGTAAAQVEFRGAFCITAVTDACIAEGWNPGCYMSSRFAPPNLGDNGTATRLSVFDGFFAENYTSPALALNGQAFKTVDGAGIGRSAFQFSSQMRISTQTPGPAALAANSPSVKIVGKIKDFDATAGCAVDFKASGINAQ